MYYILIIYAYNIYIYIIYICIIRDNIYLLNMNEEVKNVFFPGPMLSFRSMNYLLRSTLYSLHWKVGSKNVLKIILRFVIM